MNATAEEPGLSLSAAVFFGVPSVMEIKQSVDPDARDCLQKYLKAVPAGSFPAAARAPSWPEGTLEFRRRHLEEQMVIIMGGKARKAAHAFAQAVPLSLEWEGISENPIGEANFAEKWLQKHPGTAIEPFLHLFRAHRLRAGYECAKSGHEKDLRPVLAKEYRKTLEKAESFGNPLISCIAKDMEAQPYVYLKGRGRP